LSHGARQEALMSTTTSYSRPGGFLDYGQADTARLRVVEEHLLEVFRRYGYDQVRVPSLEYRDLYHRDRIGEFLYHQLLMARLSTPALFPIDPPPGYQGEPEETQAASVHELVLRPDLTAPVARMFVEGLLRRGPPQRLPYRVSYSAQAFRDLQADHLRLREHLQAGVECIGGVRASADLEVLLLACDSMAVVDKERWIMRLGHAELTHRLLTETGLVGEQLRAVGRHLERAARIRHISSIGDSDFFERYHAKVLEILSWVFPEAKESLVPKAGPHEARAALPTLHEAILRERLSAMLSTSQVDKVLAIVSLSSCPKRFFEELMPLCQSEESKASAEELQRLTERLIALRDLPLFLTAAAGRGIAYYTGMTFEVHSPNTGSPYTELGGGGRYDELHRWIYARARQTARLRGAEQLPDVDESSLNGVGLAFGLERLASALNYEVAAPIEDLLVLFEGAAQELDALRFADRLRADGLRVVCAAQSEGESGIDAPMTLCFPLVGLPTLRRGVDAGQRMSIDDAYEQVLGDMARRCGQKDGVLDDMTKRCRQRGGADG